jgi:hypothetical protein
MDDHQQIIDDFTELNLPIRKGLPKFLGVILQNYKIRDGIPKPTYQMWMDRIPLKVASSLFPKITKFNTKTHDVTSNLKGDHIVVTSIRDFEGLIPIMQEHGKPMFDISRDDTKVTNPKGKPWAGVAWTQAEARMESYKNCIQELADNLELLN